MVGERYDLRFGSLQVGIVTHTGSDYPSQRGNIVYTPVVSRSLSDQMARLVKFLNLSRTSTARIDTESDQRVSEPQQAANAELATNYRDFIESEDWRLADASDCELPITCPIFHGDRAITWRWNCGSGYEVTQSDNEVTFHLSPDRGPGRTIRATMLAAALLGIVFLIFYVVTGLWLSSKMRHGNPLTAWIFPSGIFIVLAGLSFAGIVKLKLTRGIPLQVSRKRGVHHGRRLIAAAGETRSIWLERSSQ